MKLGIFGSYNASSIGDQAILEGIIEQFRSHEDILSLLIFSFAPASTKQSLYHQKDVTITSASPKDRIAKPYRIERQDQGSQYAPDSFKYKLIKWYIRYQQSDSPFMRLTIGVIQYFFDLILLSHVSFWYKKLKEISQLDLLILGGGNIIMDLSGNWPIYPLIYAVLAKLNHVPVMLYAIGAGPVRGFRAKAYFLFTSSIVKKITLRDNESLLIFRDQIGCNGSKLLLSADPAVCLPISGEEKRTEIKPHLLFGVTVVPFNHPTLWPYTHSGVYEKYIIEMAKVLGDIANYFDARIILFATNHPTDLTPASDIASKINVQERIEIIETRPTVSGLLSLIASLDMVIGTRLHSLILSLVAGTPFLALSYQPKVKAFCNRIGHGRYVLPLSEELDIPEEEMINLIQEILERRDDIKRKEEGELKKLQKAALLSYKVAKSLVVKPVA